MEWDTPYPLSLGVGVPETPSPVSNGTDLTMDPLLGDRGTFSGVVRVRWTSLSSGRRLLRPEGPCHDRDGTLWGSRHPSRHPRG